MNPQDYSRQSDDYNRVEKAIRYIEDNFASQPSLAQIAESVNLSKYHFDRMFKRWAGISPIQFQQFITLDYTKQKLVDSRSLLDTALDAGLSGPGRLHDLFVTFEAITPGEFKRQGAGLKISYGFSDSPFGDCLLAVTERGICHLGFVMGNKRSDALGQLYETWPGAKFEDNSAAIQTMAGRIFGTGQARNLENPVERCDNKAGMGRDRVSNNSRNGIEECRSSVKEERTQGSVKALPRPLRPHAGSKGLSVFSFQSRKCGTKTMKKQIIKLSVPLKRDTTLQRLRFRD
jgi:AraC-like DNA-binding protein